MPTKKAPKAKLVEPVPGSGVALDPDEAEQREEIDNIIPTRGYHMLPLVGLGGSAGSIAALRSFFGAMPADSGLAFVVIIHLSSEHESSLAELLGRTTTMKVMQARDGIKVEANHVYVIPPGKHLTAVDGHLKLTDLAREHGKRVAVDLFFRSLADTHGPHAAAIVLSGADGDGAIGIKRVKERGGLTIAQDVNEAEQTGMPRAAVETGMVDWVLPVAEIPARLQEYYRRESRIGVPAEEAPSPATPSRESSDREAALRELLAFLRMRTGRDFSCYKRATILRRISRRMQVNGVDEISGYLALLRTNPGEAGALLKDLLISVTNFFRDHEAFDALTARIPELFAGKSQNDVVRVWVPACATGEEVYSIAMLLTEHARTIEFPPALQVFGCDLDAEAVQAARAAFYPEAITADVSAERLRRFFTAENKGYRVRRELREMVLFAAHDLLKDSPFSRMDLISCRNLLIYLTPEAQNRVMEIFHFSLVGGGLLFLGSSESVDDDSRLFRVLDKKHRLYVTRPAQHVGLPISRGPGTLARQIEANTRLSHAPVLPGPVFAPGAGQSAAARATAGRDAERISWSDVHYRLIERFAPPSLLVNADYDLQHISESAGRFLQLTGGEPTANLLRLVHPDLRLELRALLFRAAQTGQPADVYRVPITQDGVVSAIDLRVTPAGDLAPGYLLVTLSARPSGEIPGAPALQPEQGSTLQHLERELEQMKKHLRDTVEQYEASNEELKASNEELQAMNEELRSATEELETSREELQSINEELSTVNSELKSKVDELAHANGDLQNLMASTAIATVFLDRELRITRFTPAAVSIFNLIASDVGRPLSDLGHRLDYRQMRADAQQVLQSLVPVEREVGEAGGRSYLARLLPYRTADDRIGGIVLNFVDITERRRTEKALRSSEERMRLVIESAKDYAIFTTDTDRRVDRWNSAAQTMFGYSEQEILGQLADVLFVPEDLARGEHLQEARRADETGRAANERWHIRKDRSLFYGSGTVTPLRDGSGRLLGFLKIMRDLTASKQSEEALREHVDELSRFNQATEGRELRMIELKREINELCGKLGLPPSHSLDFVTEQDGPDRPRISSTSWRGKGRRLPTNPLRLARFCAKRTPSCASGSTSLSASIATASARGWRP